MKMRTKMSSSAAGTTITSALALLASARIAAELDGIAVGQLYFCLRAASAYAPNLPRRCLEVDHQRGATMGRIALNRLDGSAR